MSNIQNEKIWSRRHSISNVSQDFDLDFFHDDTSHDERGDAFCFMQGAAVSHEPYRQ